MRAFSRFNKVLQFTVLLGVLCWSQLSAAQPNGAANGESSAGENAPNTEAGYAPCTNKPTEGDTAAAKGAFQAGTAAYNEADYNRAIDYWEDAFHRDCTATALLLNLARAYESSGQLQHAIVALRTYNERNADSPQRDQIDRRIERLQEQLKSQPAAPPPAAAPVATPPAKGEPVPAPSNKPSEAKVSPSPWPLVIAIGGGAIALIGTAGYLKAKSDTKKYEAQCPNHQCPDDATQKKANDSRKAQKSSGAVAIAGAVIGVGGAIWYYFEVKRAARANAAAEAEESTHTMRLIPEVGPGYAGLSLDGHFSF
ncbi:MAG TPA: tetratricopeptide repeat protein [Polyangiaceae bacterium]|nr:tetratricopeptide repeat protein [Polyangiaceae bacterium]